MVLIPWVSSIYSSHRTFNVLFPILENLIIDKACSKQKYLSCFVFVLSIISTIFFLGTSKFSELLVPQAVENILKFLLLP